MTSFSGWGPVKDGRVKPDVVAPGCKPSAGVKTAYPPNTYDTACGTSFSTPIVAGCVGIVMQQFNDLGYVAVKPHTMKAVLVQSAEDLGNAGPDYQYGHGHVELQDAVDLVIANHPNDELIRIDAVTDGEEDTFYMDVPAGAEMLRVTLVWDDFEGTPFAAKALINDLDLMLRSPGGSWYFAYTLDPVNPSQAAGKGYNDLDNVEVVEVDSPGEGRWMIRVRGTVVPEAPQEYTVVLPYEYPSAGMETPEHRPQGFRLFQNTPNPFSQLTLIRFDLPEASPIRLRVYDTRGRAVKTLIDEPLKSAGRHIAYWDGTGDEGRALAPGVYFYRIETGQDSRTQRTVLIH
jgi:hypothetical protein